MGKNKKGAVVVSFMNGEKPACPACGCIAVLDHAWAAANTFKCPVCLKTAVFVKEKTEQHIDTNS